MATGAPINILHSTEGSCTGTGIARTRTIRCHESMKKIHTSYLDVMIALETTYMEAH